MANVSAHAIEAFGALGEPTRRAIFERLAEGPAAVGELARRALEMAIDEATTRAAAALLGVAGAAFELTRAYLCTRVQFGKAIGSFQSLAYRAVDQYVQQQLARDALADAVAMLERGVPPQQRIKEIARAKSRCGDTAMKVTRESIQMHGAIGFTDEYDAGLFLKRAVVLASWLGNGSQSRRRYSDLAIGDDQLAPSAT